MFNNIYIVRFKKLHKTFFSALITDLNSSPLENWRRPLGHSRTMWMKTTQQDLESLNLSLNEAIDVAQNRPLWRMMSTSDATH